MIRSILAALFSFVLGSSALAQSCSVPNTLANGTNADATQVMANLNAILACVNSQAAPRSYLAGLTLSTAGSSASFGIAAGVATSDDATTSMKLTASSTKTTGGWVVGSGAGSLDTGSIANNTWYHVFLIERTDTAVVDVLISQSPTSPTLPASYTKQRRIGSMKTNASAQWAAFVQLGDEFLWTTPVADIATSTLGVTPTLFTVSVPTGLKVLLNWRAATLNTSPAFVLVTSPDEVSSGVHAPAGNDSGVNSVGGVFGTASGAYIRTNTSAQIRVVGGIANTTFDLVTVGWIDRRGRDL